MRYGVSLLIYEDVTSLEYEGSHVHLRSYKSNACEIIIANPRIVQKSKKVPDRLLADRPFIVYG